MNLLRKILFPLAAIYGGITLLRNFLYDRNILKSTSFDIPVIAVGNLSVGGTGKSPQIEYLIRLLRPTFKVATLSRGYKRKSSGFIIADNSSTAEILGDEPFQFYRKFPDVAVAVDANRANGIAKLLSASDKPDVILLDDAFQHRKVEAGLYILLTTYGELYADDFLLPTGNLRESRKGAKRADVVIVTKCPPDLSEEEQLKIEMRLRLRSRQQLYFSFIEFDQNIYSDIGSIPVDEIRQTNKLILAGIAKPESFFDFLKSEGDSIMEYPDHHHFSDRDLAEIAKKAQNRPIVTTEKDYVRLQGKLPQQQLYYLPIKSTFISNSEQFDKTILNYVEQSTADR